MITMRVTHRWNETGFGALQGTIIRPWGQIILLLPPMQMIITHTILLTV